LPDSSNGDRTVLYVVEKLKAKIFAANSTRSKPARSLCGLLWSASAYFSTLAGIPSVLAPRQKICIKS
jgi:hypothetical protein